MQFIAYQNHPLKTVNARAAERAAIGALVSDLTFGQDAEIRPFKVTPRKAYHEIPRDPDAHRAYSNSSDRYLTTAELFAVVPAEKVAIAVSLPVKACRGWGRRVPQGYELYLRDLMAWWPKIAKAHQMRDEHNSTSEAIARAVRSNQKLLMSQCAYFNLPIKERNPNVVS